MQGFWKVETINDIWRSVGLNWLMDGRKEETY